MTKTTSDSTTTPVVPAPEGNRSTHRRTLASVATTVALLMGVPAAAQSPVDAEQPAGASASPQLMEITVTAQRREELAQDVPIAISAFTAEALEARNVTNLAGIDGLAPNVKLTSGGGYTASVVLSIRGGASPNPTPYNEPPTGMYVDGVYIGKSNGQLFSLADMDHIEILRGPQGTLYGRNALSGAVNIVTRKPTGEFGGTGKIGFGDYGQRTARLSLDLPRFGVVSAKLSALADEHDGYVKDSGFVSSTPSFLPAQPSRNDRLDSARNRAARAALRFDLSEDFVLDYAFDYSRSKNTPRYSQLVHVDAGSIFDQSSPVYAGIPLDEYVRGVDRVEYGAWNGTVNNERQFEHVTVRGHSLTATWGLPNVTLKSITAYRTMDWIASMDLDGSPYPVAAIIQTFDYHAFSQELQAIGEIGDRLRYTSGLFYYKDGGPSLNPQQFFTTTTQVDSRYRTSAKAYAAYLQADYVPDVLDDRLTLTAGVRYSRETKGTERYLATIDSATKEVIGEPTVPFGTKGESTFSSVTPTLIAKFQVTPDANVYVKYAKGFRSGGFTGDAANPADVLVPFGSEIIHSYEVGAKMRLFDGRLQANVDYFLNRHKDMQLLVFTGLFNGVTSTSIRNAGKAKIHGLELDVQAIPFDWLTVQATLGTLDGKYDEYMELGVDVKDQRALPSTPELTASLSVDARLLRTERFGDLHFLVDYSHQDFNYNTPTISPYFVNDEQNVTNASLRLRNVPLTNGTLEASVWVRNVFDEDFRTWSIDFGPSFGGLAVAYFNPPRTIGADVTYRF